jgi:curved DNA-binding protein CbpA
MTDEETIIAAFVVLECELGCSEEDVKSSYRQLVRVWHPDRFETDQKLKQKATEKMKLLNEAYQLLLRCFEAQRSQDEFVQKETAESQNKEAKAQTKKEKTKESEYRVGSEESEITKKRDPKTGLLFYENQIRTITGYDGRWLSTKTKLLITKMVNPDVGFESAAKDSLSFSQKPEQGRKGGKRWDGTAEGLQPEGGRRDYSDSGHDWVFPDGSSVEIHGLETDTWFDNPNKIAAHARNSDRLDQLKTAHNIYKKNRDWKACVEVSQRAVDLHGKDSWGWIQRSYALHCLKMTKEAFEALKPAVSLFPETITIFYNLACYAAKLGDTNGAKLWLKSVFDLAEKKGAYAGTFETYRKMALEDSDLVSVRNAVPQPPMAWKFRKYFGV